MADISRKRNNDTKFAITCDILITYTKFMISFEVTGLRALWYQLRTKKVVANGVKAAKSSQRLAIFSFQKRMSLAYKNK